MDLSDLISLLALALSVISLIISSRYSSKANKMAMGSEELQVRELIWSARNRVEDLSMKLFNDETKKDNEVFKQSFNSALEGVCNAYDEACSKYLDGKIDKSRFKKMYFNEIKNWVENDSVKDKYVEPQTRFHATVAVYNEWNNLEKK